MSQGEPGPLSGTKIVCIGPRGRATVHAARMLADLGATTSLVRDGGAEAVERLVLAREPAVPVVGNAGLAGLLDGATAVVVQSQDAGLRERVTGAGTNLVELTWPVDGPGADPSAQAVSGTASIVGDPDRPPLWFPHRMGEYILGQNACAMVVYQVLQGRRGAVGELSLADLWGYATGTNGLLCTPKGITYHRDGRRSPGNGGVYPQRLFRAKDGWVALLCRSSKEWAAILEALDSPAWGDEPRYRDILAMATVYPDEVDVLVEAETTRFTKAELFERAVRLGFPLAPLRDPGEVIEDDLLNRQGFWTRVGAEGTAGVDEASDGPVENADAVAVPASLWRRESWRAAAAASQCPVHELPERADLAGCRVLDLSWVWAGPMAGAFLADLGADVVKVEHGKRLDNMRLRGRMPSAIPEAHRDVDKRETDPLFHNVNRGKRSLLMDMKSDRGRELFLDLVERSDVVLESFRPHVLDSWGLGYDELKARNPKLVLVSLRGLELGDYGGESGLRSYAPVTSSLVGMESAIAYPDGDGPVGAMALGVSDPIAGWHGVGLALAALLQARRTGLGGWVKLSQLETLASTLTDMYLAEQMGGDGSDDPQPHSEGVRCADGDVLVTLHDAGWAVLTGGSEGVSSATLTGAPGRWETAADRATLEQSVGDLGGGCWPVRGVSEHSDWPARHGRRLLTEVRHDLTGREELYGHGWTLDGHQVLPTASAPVIGKHTDDVLRQYLDLDVATIEELRRSGVLS